MRRLLLASAATVAMAGLALAPNAARADVFIGFQAGGGGPITTVATGSSVAGTSASFTPFTVNNVSVISAPALPYPELSNSNSLNVKSSGGAASMNVWVSTTDLTLPGWPANLVSSFTTNTVPSGWSVTEKTFYDASNAAYGTATPLGSATFTAMGTAVASNLVAFTTPFSVTAEYIIEANGPGNVNSTIDTSVPEPGSLALLGTALLGLGLVGWERTKRRAA